ncbi:hypothetical protein, partial [Sphingomonas turrisvirgatae]|uniref:hypothetical protein n=1 Tax=Sphingomonas turrisvirgatae TaxID=1888892 RepID=UPI001F4D9ECE
MAPLFHIQKYDVLVHSYLSHIADTCKSLVFFAFSEQFYGHLVYSSSSSVGDCFTSKAKRHAHRGSKQPRGAEG